MLATRILATAQAQALAAPHPVTSARVASGKQCMHARRGFDSLDALVKLGRSLTVTIVTASFVNQWLAHRRHVRDRVQRAEITRLLAERRESVVRVVAPSSVEPSMLVMTELAVIVAVLAAAIPTVAIVFNEGTHPVLSWLAVTYALLLMLALAVLLKQHRRSRRQLARVRAAERRAS